MIHPKLEIPELTISINEFIAQIMLHIKLPYINVAVSVNEGYTFYSRYFFSVVCQQSMINFGLAYSFK